MPRVVADHGAHHLPRLLDASRRSLDPRRACAQRRRRLLLTGQLLAGGASLGRTSQLGKQKRAQVARLELGGIEPQDVVVEPQPLGRGIGGVRARRERERVGVLRLELAQAPRREAVAGLAARRVEPRPTGARGRLGPRPQRLDEPPRVLGAAALDQHLHQQRRGLDVQPGGGARARLDQDARAERLVHRVQRRCKGRTRRPARRELGRELREAPRAVSPRGEQAHRAAGDLRGREVRLLTDEQLLRLVVARAGDERVEEPRARLGLGRVERERVLEVRAAAGVVFRPQPRGPPRRIRAGAFGSDAHEALGGGERLGGRAVLRGPLREDPDAPQVVGVPVEHGLHRGHRLAAPPRAVEHPGAPPEKLARR
jgi:hypothetical protein